MISSGKSITKSTMM